MSPVVAHGHPPTGGIPGAPPGGMFGFVDKELDAFKEFLGEQWAGNSSRANFEYTDIVEIYCNILLYTKMLHHHL